MTDGGEKKKRKTTCSILSGFEICSIFSQLNKSNAPETASRSPFSKQITEGECMQLDTELTFTGVILSRLELSKAT